MSIQNKINNAKPTPFFDDDVVDGWEKWLAEHDKQIKAEVIEEIALKIQKIKDNHNENPRLYPINYGTICGICTDLWEQLKEQNK